MLNVCRLLSLSLLTLLFVAGCCCGTLKHSWVLCENQPYLEKGDYKIVKLSFYKNGSYEAVASQDNKTIKSKGMYDYNTCTDDLMLMSGDKCLCYKVRCVSDRVLELDMCSEPCLITTIVMVRSCVCPRPCRPPCRPCPPPCPTCQ